MCAVFYFGCGFTEGVGSRRRQVWLYTKVAGGRLVWLLRGLHQKQSGGSVLRKGFDGHVPVGVDGRTAHSTLMPCSTPAETVNDRRP